MTGAEIVYTIRAGDRGWLDRDYFPGEGRGQKREKEMSTHIIIWGLDIYTLEADWGQAAGVVWWCGDATQWQVADFRHEWEVAARRLLREEARDGGIDPDDPDVAAEIDQAVAAAVWTSPIEAAYRDAQVRWTGLDWTTDHGPWQVDLDGLDADRLREIADRVAAGGEEEEDLAYLPDRIAYLPDRIWLRDRAEIAEWLRDAAEYLDEVVSDAAAAEEAGEEAIEAVRRGDLDAALEHAENACGFESQYGDCPVWGGLRDAIRQAIEEREEAEA